MIISGFELTKILADGAFHSGEALAARFGVTRASISKAMARIQHYGLDVHSVRGKGYRLSDRLVLLDHDAIIAGLPAAVRAAVGELTIFDCIDSTNTWLLDKLHRGAPPLAGQCSVCLSEMQTAGRGRRGRTWVSPFGHNIYLSLLKEFPAGVQSLDGVSLVVSLALLRALRRWGLQNLGLKWPNDLLVEGRKLAGVLLEMSGDTLGSCHLVIGIGLNVKLLPGDMESVCQPWTTLLELGFPLDSRNQLVAALLESLVTVLDEFQRSGFSAFRAEWSANDITQGHAVEIVTAAGSISGVSRGVDLSGALLVETVDGMQKFNTGEVSLRKRGDVEVKA